MIPIWWLRAVWLCRARAGRRSLSPVRARSQTPFGARRCYRIAGLRRVPEPTDAMSKVARRKHQGGLVTPFGVERGGGVVCARGLVGGAVAKEVAMTHVRRGECGK